MSVHEKNIEKAQNNKQWKQFSYLPYPLTTPCAVAICLKVVPIFKIYCYNSRGLQKGCGKWNFKRSFYFGTKNWNPCVFFIVYIFYELSTEVQCSILNTAYSLHINFICLCERHRTWKRPPTHWFASHLLVMVVGLKPRVENSIQVSYVGGQNPTPQVITTVSQVLH